MKSTFNVGVLAIFVCSAASSGQESRESPPDLHAPHSRPVWQSAVEAAEWGKLSRHLESSGEKTAREELRGILAHVAKLSLPMQTVLSIVEAFPWPLTLELTEIIGQSLVSERSVEPFDEDEPGDGDEAEEGPPFHFSIDSNVDQTQSDKRSIALTLLQKRFAIESRHFGPPDGPLAKGVGAAVVLYSAGFIDAATARLPPLAVVEMCEEFEIRASYALVRAASPPLREGAEWNLCMEALADSPSPALHSRIAEAVAQTAGELPPGRLESLLVEALTQRPVIGERLVDWICGRGAAAPSDKWLLMRQRVRAAGRVAQGTIPRRRLPPTVTRYALVADLSRAVATLVVRGETAARPWLDRLVQLWIERSAHSPRAGAARRDALWLDLAMPGAVVEEACEGELLWRLRVAKARLLTVRRRPLEALDVIERLDTDDGSLRRNLVDGVIEMWTTMSLASESPTREWLPNGLKGLKVLRERLDRMAPEATHSATVAAAFVRLATAEQLVARQEVESFFGQIPAMSEETVIALANALAEELGDVDPPPADAPGTPTLVPSRARAGDARELQLADELFEVWISGHPARWKAHLARAELLLARAHRRLAQNLDAVGFREFAAAALAAFESGFMSYSAAAADGDATLDAEPFLGWFETVVRLISEPATKHHVDHDAIFERLATAFQTAVFPPRTRAWLKRQLVTAIDEGIENDDPHLKNNRLRCADRLVGDEPGFKHARDLLKMHDRLIRQVHLRLRLDGPPRIGLRQEFGVFVEICHTANAEQLVQDDSQKLAFARYLIDQLDDPNATRGRGIPQVNYRTDFENRLTRTFATTFDVVAVKLHTPNVKSRPANPPEAGYPRAFPIGFVVLKPKSVAVDKIPSVDFDLDFFQPETGAVVLRITSNDIPFLEVTADLTAPRATAMTHSQTLNDRDVVEGRLRVDLALGGRGVVPRLSDILAADVEGFSTTFHDGALQVELDDVTALPTSRRHGWIDLAWKGQNDEANFEFPRLRDGLAKADLLAPPERYCYSKVAVDTEKLEVMEATIRLTGLPSRNGGRQLLIGGILLVAVAIFVVGFRLLRGRSTASRRDVRVAAKDLPRNRLGAARYLRGLLRNTALRWPAEDRRRLEADAYALDDWRSDNDPKAAVAPLDPVECASRWAERAAAVGRGATHD